MKVLYFTIMGQIVSLFFLIYIGFFVKRREILPNSTAKVLSILETHIFLPALVFKNMVANFRKEFLVENLLTIMKGSFFLIIILIFGYILSNYFRKKTPLTKNILLYLFTFPNYGYFGYPVIGAIFGEKMLFNTMIFTIPISVAIYSLGVWMINGFPQKKNVNSPQKDLKEETLSIKKLLLKIGIFLSPVMGGLILGVVWGLMQLPLPKPIYESVSMLALCMGPVAMLLTGFVLASHPTNKLFNSIHSYIISFIRLLLIPLLVGLIFFFLNWKEYLLIPVIISAMPLGLNVIVFQEAAGKDTKEYARICFISYLLSIFTIPFILMFFLRLLGNNCL